MAIPINNLTLKRDVFDEAARWKILVARYNYSRYLSEKEFTMTPQLSKTNFHLYEEYAVLKLKK